MISMYAISIIRCAITVHVSDDHNMMCNMYPCTEGYSVYACDEQKECAIRNHVPEHKTMSTYVMASQDVSMYINIIRSIFMYMKNDIMLINP